jgi:hypothetical protein
MPPRTSTSLTVIACARAGSVSDGPPRPAPGAHPKRRAERPAPPHDKHNELGELAELAANLSDCERTRVKLLPMVEISRLTSGER